MTFLNPLDALIPKIPLSFFADFWVWVTSEARGSVSVGFLGSHQLSPFWGRGEGSSQGAVSTPPPGSESMPTPEVWLFLLFCWRPYISDEKKHIKYISLGPNCTSTWLHFLGEGE